MSAPYRVVASGGNLLAAAAELRRGGWRTMPGFALPATPWDLTAERIALVGEVTDQRVAMSALRAAERGAALVIRLDLGHAWSPMFLAELERLAAGQGDPRPVAIDGSTMPAQLAGLTRQHLALLELLAGGVSIAAAARQLYVSLRTANRRAAEIRAALEVSTTREAVAAYRRALGHQ